MNIDNKGFKYVSDSDIGFNGHIVDPNLRDNCISKVGQCKKIQWLDNCISTANKYITCHSTNNWEVDQKSNPSSCNSVGGGSATCSQTQGQFCSSSATQPANGGIGTGTCDNSQKCYKCNVGFTKNGQGACQTSSGSPFRIEDVSLSNKYDLNFKICNTGTTSLTFPPNTPVIMFTETDKSTPLYNSDSGTSGVKVASADCFTGGYSYESVFNDIGVKDKSTSITITADPSGKFGTPIIARFPTTGTLCFGTCTSSTCSYTGLNLNSAQSVSCANCQNKQYKLGSLNVNGEIQNLINNNYHSACCTSTKQCVYENKCYNLGERANNNFMLCIEEVSTGAIFSGCWTSREGTIKTIGSINYKCTGGQWTAFTPICSYSGPSLSSAQTLTCQGCPLSMPTITKLNGQELPINGNYYSSCCAPGQCYTSQQCINKGEISTSFLCTDNANFLSCSPSTLCDPYPYNGQVWYCRTGLGPNGGWIKDVINLCTAGDTSCKSTQCTYQGSVKTSYCLSTGKWVTATTSQSCSNGLLA